MTPTTTLRRLTTTVVGATLAFTMALTTPMAARAQEGAESAPPPAPPRPVLAMEHAGLMGLFPDPKDAGLRSALSMLGTRLKEMKADPSMDDDFREVPDGAIDLVETLLTSPMRMGVTLGAMDPNTNMPRFGVVVSFDLGDEARATALDRNVEQLRAMADAPFTPEASQRWATMHDLAMPFGVLTYGPRKAPGGWRYEMIFGEVENPDDVASYLPAYGKDVSGAPAARAMLDLAALTPLSEMLGGMMSMFTPQAGQVMQRMRASGIVGAEAMAVELTAGCTPTHGVERWVVRRAGRYAEALGLPTAALTAADLAVVPADATVAQIKKMDIQHSWAQAREQFTQAGIDVKVDEFLAQFREHTGVDLERDVIAALGDTSVAYLSDSTGGGSFLSGVVAIKLKDAKSIGDALTKLTGLANQMAPQAEMGPGALRLETSKHGNAISLTSVRVRGLPMPLEPSFAVSGEWLVLGASAQSCAAGARQIDAKGPGLRGNASFAAAWPKGTEAIGLAFVDFPRTIRSGYTSVSLLGSALSNFVASPDGARDAGPVVGAYGDLTKDVRPLLAVTRWAGDDLVVDMTADRSTLVNVAGILGVGEVGSLIMGAMIGGGATAGAMEQKHQSNTWYDESEEHEHEPASSSDEEVPY